MKTRLLIAAGVAALLLSSASTRAASSSFESVASAGVLVAVCDDGGGWVAVAVPVSPTDALGTDALLPLAGVGSVLSANGCIELVLVPPFDGSVVPDPGDVMVQDAAVWSRQGPVDRSSVAP